VGALDYEADDIQLLIYLDHASIELFADYGRCVMTEIFFPSKPLDKAEIISHAGPIQLEQGKISTLKSIWIQ
jgi:sucrose-6-phosphate hydrolase SacC (GH32 family)